jgi:hypothetical protein
VVQGVRKSDTRLQRQLRDADEPELNFGAGARADIEMNAAEIDFGGRADRVDRRTGITEVELGDDLKTEV